MGGCVEGSPELYDYCSCTYNYLELTIGKSGIVKFGLDMIENGDFEMTEDIEDAIIFCADKI